MSDRPHLICSEIFRKSRFGAKHPLSVPRVTVALDLIRAMGWIDEDQYLDGPEAAPIELARFHDPDYIAAVRKAERQGLDEWEKKRWNIGVGGNPIYGEVFRRPATAAGSSLLAADMLLGPGIVHSPAGGTHHGQRDRASGFCYINDPVLAILRMLDHGIGPIAYVDLDAHHGDGVEQAFAMDDRVLTVSVHEAGRWPAGKGVETVNRPGIVNIPVPAAFNDDEFLYVLDAAILPIVSDFQPAAIVLQCGVDGLADDPLSRLALSNRVFPKAVVEIGRLSPRFLVLGGGGYNPWAVGRAWAMNWAVLNRIEIPDEMPEEASAILRSIEWKHSRGRNPPERLFTRFLDPPNHGPIREDVREIVKTALQAQRAGGVVLPKVV